MTDWNIAGRTETETTVRDKLVSDYFESHREFVTNPLLLTLMLMSYHRFADVPEKSIYFTIRHIRHCCKDTILTNWHISGFRSVNDPSDFTKVFREFCAKSYRKGDYEFSQNKFEDYFDKLKAITA